MLVLVVAVVEPLPDDLQMGRLSGLWKLSKTNLKIIGGSSL